MNTMPQGKSRPVLPESHLIFYSESLYHSEKEMRKLSYRNKETLGTVVTVGHRATNCLREMESGLESS
jgi:hypothetical protein